ncbi:MAG: glycerol-3-phosphate cytidylyltransferase [Erysipelotrichaceae bacterium]|nr:glycerol-3-phosphate cytidylyltransferase [Erysipelotrichaceae bacterium]
MASLSIIGAGTWGIALANMLADSGHDVTVWSAIGDEIDYIAQYHKHPKLKDVAISTKLSLTKDLREAIEGKDIIVMAVPSVFVRSTAKQVGEFIKEDQIIVDVAKGIEPVTLMTMSEVIHEEINKIKPFDYGQLIALSGPTHAEEVSIGLPSTIVSAGVNIENAKFVQEVFSAPYMRVYTNDDIRGTEICGALKNIVALAAGIAHGLGYGDNATAALVTRGIHEITTLGLAMGCSIHTFYGLAGIGDLVVTCTSRHSRNNQCGTLIGQGYDVETAKKKVGMVVEGISALEAADALRIKYHVEMPIMRSVFNIINFSMPPAEEVKRLYARQHKSEEPFDVLMTIYDNPDVTKEHHGMKRVITYGTFDMLHYGHINLLRRAKALGDYLIVALSTDEFATLVKHKHCYFNYNERKSLLEAMRYVDLVIPEENWEQKMTDCKEYHIDILVMGDDWKGKFDYLKDQGVEVIYVPRTPEISTTKIKADLHSE